MITNFKVFIQWFEYPPILIRIKYARSGKQDCAIAVLNQEGVLCVANLAVVLAVFMLKM